MAVDVFNFQMIKAVEAARSERRDILRELFTHQAALVVATSKEEKAAAMLALFKNISSAEPSNGVSAFQSSKPELSHPNAAAVAKNKAWQFLLAIRENPNDPDLARFASMLTVSCGSDVNFWDFSEKGEPNQEHKLERRYPSVEQMPDSEFEALRIELREKYCFPQNGRVRVVWDLATHIINGSAHTFTDQIEVISGPVDLELLDKYLFAARENGLLLSSNSHLALIEMLRENKQILSAAILPGELRSQGKTFANLRIDHPSETMMAAIEKAIVNNALYYEA